MRKALLLLLLLLVRVACSAQFTATLTGNPINTNGWTFGGSGFVNGPTFTLTNPINNEAGYIYYSTPTNLTSCGTFTVDFDFQIIPPAGCLADGIAFWYISNPPAGFILGGGIGLPNDPNGFIMIMDTYDNNGNGDNPLVTMLGYNGLINYVEGSPNQVVGNVATHQNFIDDGAWHHCQIFYNNGALSVFFDYSLTPTVSGNHSINQIGYFGFSASTGGCTSTQNIKNVNIVSSPVLHLPTVTPVPPKVIRGCKPAKFVFNISPADTTDTLVVHYDVYGTAVNGYDYQTIPDSVIFPPHATADTVDIFPLGVPPTGPKTIKIRVYATTLCNGLPVALDSTTMTIYDSVKVNVVTHDSTLCNGDSLHVITTADSFLNHYLWTPNLVITNDTTLSPVITPPLDTVVTYVITATSDTIYGCTSTDSITLTTRSIKIDSAKVTTSSCNACDGVMTIYGLVPGEHDTITYNFAGNAATPVPVVADSNGVVHITGLCPGIYSNIFAHFGICLSPPIPSDTVATLALTANSMTFTNPTKCGFCDGTITLSDISLSTADTVTYTINGVTNVTVGPFNVMAGGSIVLGGLCEGNYGNIIIHSGFCTSPAYGTFSLVNPALNITGVNTTNATTCGVCDGTISLHGLPETQFDTVIYRKDGIWQPYIVFPVGMDNTINLINLCPGTYDSIEVFTSGGCSTISVGPYTITGPSLTAGFNYTIHYSCKGPDTVVFQNTSNPLGVSRWHFGDNTMDTSLNPTHTYAMQGIYQVTLYASNLPCEDSITQTIDTRHPISAAFSISPSDTLCNGGQINFNNTSSGGNLTYNWTLGDGSVPDNSLNPPVHTYLNAGTYHIVLTVTDTLGCTDTAKDTIVVDPTASISITASDTSICAGQSIIFHGNYTKQGNTGITWDLGDGYTVNNVNPVTHAYAGSNLPQSITVKLSATDRVCPDTAAEKTIHVFPYPVINLGTDTSMCPGSTSITLSDNLNGGNPLAQWQWNTGETTSAINVTQPGLYYTTVTITGCSNSDSVLVRNDCYVGIPNVFTPNGDGTNDYFFPRHLLGSGYTSFSMNIYNRWGQLIFTTTSTEGEGWDGKFNGVAQPEGVYIYIIDVSFKDGKHEHHQGNVTILR